MPTYKTARVTGRASDSKGNTYKLYSNGEITKQTRTMREQARSGGPIVEEVVHSGRRANTKRTK